MTEGKKSGAVEASRSPHGYALAPEEAALLSVHGSNYQEPLPGRERLYRALTRRGLLQSQMEMSVLCRYKSYRLTDSGALALAAHNASLEGRGTPRPGQGAPSVHRVPLEAIVRRN